MGNRSANPSREPLTFEGDEGDEGTTLGDVTAIAGGPIGSDTEVPGQMPVLPVRGVVVFPGTVVPLTIGREKSKRLIDAVIAGDKKIAVFAQRRDDVDDPGIDDVYRVGTAAQVLKLLRMPDGTNTLLVHGIIRVGLIEFTNTEPFWTANVEKHDHVFTPSMALDALAFNARQTAQKVIELSPNVPDEALQILESIDKPGALADFLAANLSLGLVQKQELLETFDVEDRLRKVNATLQNQLEVLELAQKLQTDVRGQIDKSQREYYLHEQMKAIQRELGEDEGGGAQIAELRQRIDAAHMPDVVRTEAKRELSRLERIPQASAEHGVIRDYLDWLLDVPWEAETTDDLDLDKAEQILDADHHGLEKIKRRILEFLAIRKLKPDGKSPILCFAGPPGVGKTSLGHSIARAMGRKFIRIALGGVRDEADIRGHRRTYIGAMPGRIMQEIRKIGVRNPVIMLDEMDKLGADFRGDPASALLEVLDPAQNHSFTDHYLGVPFDLSHALFIGTANYMDPVEPALKDRMEIIELAGYTSREKFEIARRFLAPRQVEQNGLDPAKLRFADDALRLIIDDYTREAGVRNLERSIGTVCRGLAARAARGKSVPATIGEAEVRELLGIARYDREKAQTDAVPGVVTGLAYTPVGGDIIFIEATRMQGRGNFQLTGQLGDVMRESALAAMSLIRAHAREWAIDPRTLRNVDIHIHVPAGGIPKDGPSAGVAMLTALYTIFTGLTADPKVGMTGEITLRGLVLPIGGVKEKVLAAHRAGLKKVILPKRNEPDVLEEVPDEIRKAMQFEFVENVEQVLMAAVPGLKRATPPKDKTATPRGVAKRVSTHAKAAKKRRG